MPKMITFTYKENNENKAITITNKEMAEFAATRYFLPQDKIRERAKQKKIIASTKGKTRLFFETLASHTMLSMGLLSPVCAGLYIVNPIAGAVGTGFAFAGSVIYGAVGAVGERKTNVVIENDAVRQINEKLAAKESFHDYLYGDEFKNFLTSLATKKPVELQEITDNLAGTSDDNPLKSRLKLSGDLLAKPADDTDEKIAARVNKFQKLLANDFLTKEYIKYLEKPQKPALYNLGLKHSFTALGSMALLIGIGTAVVGLAVATAGLSLVAGAAIALGIIAVSAIVALGLTKKKHDVEMIHNDRDNAISYLESAETQLTELKTCQAGVIHVQTLLAKTTLEPEQDRLQSELVHNQEQLASKQSELTHVQKQLTDVQNELRKAKRIIHLYGKDKENRAPQVGGATFWPDPSANQGAGKTANVQSNVPPSRPGHVKDE